MLTINAEIKKDGLRSDGTYNVKLRFTLDRKMRRLSTSLFVTSKDLTKEFKIKQNSPIKQEIDSLIRSYQERCAKLQVELNHYTIDEVMDYLDGEYLHIPADTRSAFPVISVQSPVSIQCCWQS